MKRIIFLLIAVLGITTVFAQNQAATAKAPIEFKESKHNFGKIKQGTPVTYTFNFKNTSAGPVIIEDATATCGCTKPEFPKGVIAKGATNKISVTYNAAAMGTFTKPITVKIAKVTEPIMLSIEGEVVGASSASTKKP
jgi:hypothetical protein